MNISAEHYLKLCCESQKNGKNLNRVNMQWMYNIHNIAPIVCYYFFHIPRPRGTLLQASPITKSQVLHIIRQICRMHFKLIIYTHREEYEYIHTAYFGKCTRQRDQECSRLYVNSIKYFQFHIRYIGNMVLSYVGTNHFLH